LLIEGGKDLPGLMKLEVVPKGSSERTVIPPSELLAVVSEEKISSEKPVFPVGQVRELADFLFAHLENATPRVALEIDGKDIGLNPFVQGFIESTVRGMLGSLKDVEQNPKRIALKLIRREDEDDKL